MILLVIYLFFLIDAVHAPVQPTGQAALAEVVRGVVRHTKEEDLS